MISKMFTGRRLVTLTITSTVAAAGYFAYRNNYFTHFIANQELSRDKFTKYKISWKKDIDVSHYLLELTPVVAQKRNLWREHAYNKLWSVEIKQPEIHVVRSYTPLPLIHNKNQETELQVLGDNDNGGGKMMFYIKQYSHGEVARWLHGLPNGSEIEVRGPYIEYELPEYPDDETVRDRSFLNDSVSIAEPVEHFQYEQFDINFFTGGTGIVAALQLLLTENPFRGSINLFHGTHDISELGPLQSLLSKLEKHKRVTLSLSTKFREDLEAKFKTKICLPQSYNGIVTSAPKANNNAKTVGKSILSLVVGPPGFIKAVSGEKYDMHQGPIQGVLGELGWDNSNVFKLS